MSKGLEIMAEGKLALVLLAGGEVSTHVLLIFRQRV